MNRADRIGEIVSLAQEVAEVPAAETESAIRHALSKLVTWIGATNAYWIGAVREEKVEARDPMLGWRARDMLFLHDHEQMVGGSAELAARINAGEVDPATVANVQRAGTTRCLLRHELVPDAIWKRSWVPNEYQIPRGIHDQLVSANALDARHESYVGLVRGAGEGRFGCAEQNALLLFMQSSRRFHRRVMLFRGLLGIPALTEREQDVLRLLVTAGSEKEIARSLGIGERTVHQHAFVIYRKLGVHGRIGLLSFVA